MRSIEYPRTAFLFLLILLFPAVAAAQVPADEILKDFKINGDFVLEMGAGDVEGAEIFFSERAVAYLVMAPRLSSPIMISLRSRSVESVHLMKVLKKDDGTVDILADADLQPMGSFHLEGTEVTFTVGDEPARLKPTPWLLGRQPGQTLKEHNPEYAFKASTYGPGNLYLQSLRDQPKDVRVVVYFGSWCPVCKRVVPRILRIEDELDGSKIEFEYYGLPRPFDQEPAAERDDIHGVPTVLVYVDGQEKLRLTGRDLEAPEASLSRALGSS